MNELLRKHINERWKDAQRLNEAANALIAMSKIWLEWEYIAWAKGMQDRYALAPMYQSGYNGMLITDYNYHLRNMARKELNK